MDKATKRPWELRPHGSYSYAGLEGFIKKYDLLVISVPCPPWALGAAGVLVTGNAVGKEQQDANARLIVTAVNSHDALVEACEIVVRGVEAGDLPDGLAYRKCKAALKLAEGKVT